MTPTIPLPPDDFLPYVFIAPSFSSPELNILHGDWIDCSTPLQDFLFTLDLFISSHYNSTDFKVIKWANFYELESLLPFHPMHQIRCNKPVIPLKRANCHLISHLGQFITKSSQTSTNKVLDVPYSKGLEIAFKLACTLNREGLWRCSEGDGSAFDTLYRIINQQYLGSFNSIESFCKHELSVNYNYSDSADYVEILDKVKKYIDYSELYNYELSKDIVYIEQDNQLYFFRCY